MRTRSLAGSHHGFLGQHLHSHGSLGGILQLPSRPRLKEGQRTISVCRFSTTPFGEQYILICNFGTTWRNVITDTCSGNSLSRRIASKDHEFDAVEIPEEWDAEEVYDKELGYYRGLVLDVTYRPINVVCWRRALCLEILEKADVLEYYDQVINSPTRAFAIPAVLRITDYVHTPKHARMKLPLNRKSIFLRDKYRCQYCNARDELTLDHVVPVSRGGEWSWQNLVTACSKCNTKKGDKTLEAANMHLIKVPKEPNVDARDMPSNYSAYQTLSGSRMMPTEWIGYLPERFRPSKGI